MVSATLSSANKEVGDDIYKVLQLAISAPDKLTGKTDSIDLTYTIAPL